jgi:hypothetical protein
MTKVIMKEIKQQKCACQPRRYQIVDDKHNKEQQRQNNDYLGKIRHITNF